MNKINDNIPWVEKYRPTDLNDIILDNINKKIIDNIIKDNYFPNLILYGPPGIGKTTTLINLIKEFTKSYDTNYKNLYMHFNASDDRGIETIRNHIKNFVKCKSLYTNENKFIILDEADYLTKNAQNALKYIVKEYNNNIRFCLICNYLSKI